MYRSFLSLRYMVARRTNLIAVVGLTVAVGALILTLAIMSGFLDQSRKTIRGTLSDILIAPVHLRRIDGRDVPLQPDRLLAVVRSDRRVEAAAAQLVWGAIIGLEEGGPAMSDYVMSSQTLGQLPMVQLVGVDLPDETDVTSLGKDLREAKDPMKEVADPERPFEPPPGFRARGRPLRGIVMGESLMHKLQIRRGDVVNLYTVVPDREEGGLLSNNRRFVVAGAFRSGENEMDVERVYLERRELEDFIGSERGFSNVLLRLGDYSRDGPAVREDLARGLDWLGLSRGLSDEVRTWEQFRGSLLGAIQNERTLLGLIVCLVMVVAGFTVFAILSMMVTEKRRDIGILTALGATPRGVMATFLMIAFWDALVGSILGTAAGLILSFQINPIERWLSSTLGIEIFRRDIYLFDYIPTRVDPEVVGLTVLGAFACSLAFAALPAWAAARIDPLEALRYE